MSDSFLPVISAIICTWNRADELAGALESFNHQTLPRNQWELIVVDNNSTDATPETIGRLKSSVNYTLINVVEKRQGLSRARNTGIESARANLIAFTDDDCLVDPGWLLSILSIFESNLNVDILGGPGLTVYPEITRTDAKKRILAERFFGDFRPYETLTRVETHNLPIGFNFSFRRIVSEKVGGFDPNLGVTGSNYVAWEETAFIRQALKLGFQCYFDPRPVIHHRIQPGRIGWPTIRKETYQCAIGAYLMKHAEQVRKNPWNRLRLSMLYSLALLYACIRFVLCIPSFRKRANALFRIYSAAGKLKALWSF